MIFFALQAHGICVAGSNTVTADQCFTRQAFVTHKSLVNHQIGAVGAFQINRVGDDIQYALEKSVGSGVGGLLGRECLEFALQDQHAGQHAQQCAGWQSQP